MDDYFRSEFDTMSAPPKRDNLFAWTVFILLLIGMALACWLGSFYVFGHPEKPRSYRILQKLHKIEPPKRFELTAAPAGEFLSPQKLFEKYNIMSRLQLQNENDELLRNYINNYQNTKKAVPYVIGRFNILDSYELKPTDLFPSGVVALAQSVDFPQLLMEHVYTAEQKNVPTLRKMLSTGLDVKLEKTLDLAAVIHFERLFNGSLQVTVVPLLYGSYALKQGSGTFSLEPPLALNLQSGAPIIRTALLQDALKTYAEYKRKVAPEPTALEKPTASPSAPPPASAELVRADANPAEEVQVPMSVPTGKGDKLAARGVATPLPLNSKPAAHPSAAAPALAMNSPHANASPASARIAAASPPPVAVSPQGVPLQPFLQSAPAHTFENTGASWRTFPAGQLPRGRVVDSQESAQLAERGVGSERLYLRGQFVVTASGENRAVLRAQNGGISGIFKAGSGSARVIVEYPAGMNPPTEGAQFSRDDTRPFQITDVRRGADGQINIYVREITAQE